MPLLPYRCRQPLEPRLQWQSPNLQAAETDINSADSNITRLHIHNQNLTRLPTMPKRQAEESLEDVAADSPASKKSRANGQYAATLVPHDTPAPVKGREREEDERNGHDILAAADEEGEELEEFASAPEDADGADVEGDESAYTATSRQQAPIDGYTDLYLDTIDRSVLDFDFEKLCSVTLSNINVYACLVCGKYYQGRGPKSHAYFHALEVGHHVFVNMQTKRVYVLPEGYEVKSKSLDDIKFVVDPQLSKDEVVQLDKEAQDTWDLAGKKYRPGQLYLPPIELI